MHGWLIIDKPRGMTSTAVGNRLRRLLGTKKIGHAGTLDPGAEGVLPLAIGEATKTMPLFVDCGKSYRFDIRWGEARDSGDLDGALIASDDRVPALDDVLRALPAFTGNITQVPPVYSAVKFAGRRACDLARAGTPPQMQPRQVQVHRWVHESRLDECTDRFVVDCGKGTYIRSLAVDLAAHLGVLACIRRLRRIAVGPFVEADAISPDSSAEMLYTKISGLTRLPVGIPAPTLQPEEAAQVRCGIGVVVQHAPAPRAVALCNGMVVALGRIEALDQHRFLPDRVLIADAVKGPNYVDYP